MRIPSSTSPRRILRTVAIDSPVALATSWDENALWGREAMTLIREVTALRPVVPAVCAGFPACGRYRVIRNCVASAEISGRGSESLFISALMNTIPAPCPYTGRPSPCRERRSCMSSWLRQADVPSAMVAIVLPPPTSLPGW